MKTDKELLELAAKAAGYDIKQARNCTGMHPAMNLYAAPFWNPLTDDGDAFRLAVELNIAFVFDVNPSLQEMFVKAGVVMSNMFYELVINGDKEAATRRAIVRAAAAIGESK